MRTDTLLGALVCVIGMTVVAADAEAAWSTFDQPRETVSITTPTNLPPNIVVSPDLNDVVAQMWRESETFRRQTKLIGRQQRLRVRVILEDYRDGDRLVRARCELRRYEFGAITALVHVWSLDDAVELIAHELEHALEFAEGTNYRARSVMQPGSVWATDRAYETSRAVEMGLQAKREVRVANLKAGGRR